MVKILLLVIGFMGLALAWTGGSLYKLSTDPVALDTMASQACDQWARNEAEKIKVFLHNLENRHN